MKKFFALVAFAMFFVFSANAAENQYKLDNASIDALFASAQQVSLDEVSSLSPLADFASSSNAQITEEKEPVIAFILAWFLGPLGIHRAYLGTSTGTIIAYILTLGGCGIVAFVDWVVLLIGMINNDISKYVDNPKFFMW